MPRIAYRARYVFPMDGPPFEGGAVVVEGDRIVAVGRGHAADEVRDLGNVAILPGLVNAHTHLEFSDVTDPLGAAGMPLPQWIRKVILFRRSAQRAADAIERGLRESARAGTLAVGEIAQPGYRSECFHNALSESVVFLELLALSEERATEKLREARQHLARTAEPTGTIIHGLSPHAPYTVRWDLFEHAIDLSREHQVPVAFHLAESREELRLLQSADGPLRDLFDELGFWVAGAIPRDARPLDYLRALSSAPRSLIVHGNYLDDEEIAYVAAHAERMSVVYCPRTHAYFGHTEHPWRRMLASGVNVALGTDSRASNPDLSLLAEVRYQWRQAATVDAATLLHMATLSGARALGLDAQIGSLTPGKLANLTILPLGDQTGRDPHVLVLECDSSPSAFVWRGIYRQFM